MGADMNNTVAQRSQIEGEDNGPEFQFESGLESNSDNGGGIFDPGDVRKWFESFDSANLLKDLVSLDLGDNESDGEMDVLGSDEIVKQSCPHNEELALAALRDLPNLGAKRRVVKEDTLRRLDATDFEEGMPRLAFRIIQANVEALFAKKMVPESYVKAAQWVFGRSFGEWTFENCCAVLGARIDVIRLRVHYEFWLRWYCFPVDFPFMIDPVPDAVADEIFIISGDEGSDLARAAWMQPGIRSFDLLRHASRGRNEDKYRYALEMLADKYILSQKNDCWYLTGRNPALRAHDLAIVPNKQVLHQISWSKMF